MGSPTLSCATSKVYYSQLKRKQKKRRKLYHVHHKLLLKNDKEKDLKVAREKRTRYIQIKNKDGILFNRNNASEKTVEPRL